MEVVLKPAFPLSWYSCLSQVDILFRLWTAFCIYFNWYRPVALPLASFACYTEYRGSVSLVEHQSFGRWVTGHNSKLTGFAMLAPLVVANLWPNFALKNQGFFKKIIINYTVYDINKTRIKIYYVVCTTNCITKILSQHKTYIYRLYWQITSIQSITQRLIQRTDLQWRLIASRKSLPYHLTHCSPTRSFITTPLE